MKFFLKKNLPMIILIVLSVIPIFRWFFLEPLSFRFSDFNGAMTSFGQITGLLGMMLFALNLVISNRSIFFDKIFSGLHNFYNAHKWLGSLSFSFLLFHPIFLVIKYLSISFYDAAMFLLPGSNFAVTMGIFSLLLMIVLLSVTLYFKIKYHIWMFSHKFMILVFVFAILHVLFISSDISRDVFLKFYILFFSILGLISGFYRSFLRFIFNKDFKYIIKNISILNNNVVDIEMESEKEIMSFKPGQFIFIKFIGEGISSESHPFSISSSSKDSNLKITVKYLGDFTSTLNNLKAGMKAEIEGPFGEFFENRKNKKEIWLAGGVGITPFLSLARSLDVVKNDIYLFYCLRDPNEAVSSKELQDLSLSNNKFHFITWCSNEKGMINADEISKLTNGTIDTDIYLCGPPPFMKGLEGQLISKGVSKSDIYFEEFNFI